MKKCVKCGSTQNLHAHHVNVWRKGLKREKSFGKEIVDLCSSCHAWVHSYGNTKDEYLKVTKHRPDEIPKLNGDEYGGAFFGSLKTDYLLADYEKDSVRALMKKLTTPINQPT